MTEADITAKIHLKLAHLSCAKNNHNNTPSPATIKEPIEEANIKQGSTNATLTAKDEKRMSQEVLDGKPSRNTQRKKTSKSW
mmetsp:Transcript_18226/g.20996  ORF Transcript_18226/g.20996 Transcript_18226/m.20996 type:complete len:82 (+) Transcript_18226:586-831(+)|eukprot:CAMPEP_0194385718 /NCGR_PEP_ID=MMETSP0174-20130528/82110_1 /TAXON_ID=216777 /ORGANISM="Proboscia alata, Strain PI-D3" /LENGTH=81 /DNA_ID=CAMNT_0039174139 /DNA_START=420 /DNA_END=665 /DNA_ORIENTATION=-